METKANGPMYSITETPDLRTSLAMNFYCEEIQKRNLGSVEVEDMEYLANQAVMAADAFLKALNEKVENEN